MAVNAKPNVRNALLTAAALSVIGVGIAGTVSREVGGVILVASWIAFVVALHAFGRAEDD
jgi:hypothetical protein